MLFSFPVSCFVFLLFVLFLPSVLVLLFFLIKPMSIIYPCIWSGFMFPRRHPYLTKRRINRSVDESLMTCDLTPSFNMCLNFAPHSKSYSEIIPYFLFKHMIISSHNMTSLLDIKITRSTFASKCFIKSNQIRLNLA